ncbi:hypothetical protein GE061_001737 [Apolygus lucorum]|uniref:Elongation of very long chain fatty acids protein n=1 Tax=Apolygus lucorum TaxID=248454 RepID=A0A8S9Y7X7_APOLU|nr:hypothetical protein GE061_001737 [Apolygus lucorum]
MAGVIGAIVDGYHDILENYSDPRVKDWALMSSPLPTLAICLTYAFVVKIAGPKFMETRKPFELQKTLIVYNAFQVIFSAFLFREALHAGWFSTYSFRCQPVDYSNSEHALRVAGGCWWYYFSKFTEFMDTFFFVLRKKNDHVNRLHVIHHGIMPLSTWFEHLIKFSEDKAVISSAGMLFSKRWDTNKHESNEQSDRKVNLEQEGDTCRAVKTLIKMISRTPGW